jgi:hypothetical protein
MACYKCHIEAAGYVENTHAKRRFCSAKCQSRYYEIGGAADGKVLPPIPYPKHALIIAKQYEAKDLIMSYGTVFTRDLMVKEGMPTDNFDQVLERAVISRRSMLSRYITRVETNTFERGERLPNGYFSPDFIVKDKPKVHQFLISPWLSPNLYTELMPYANEVADAGANQQKALLDFMKRVLLIDEYLLNWRSFRAVIGLKDYDEPELLINDEKKSVFNHVILKYRAEAKTKFSIEVYAPRIISPLFPYGIRKVPKGTLVYRGFKTYRKPLDTALNYAFFAMDMIYTLGYLKPELEPDKDYLSTPVNTASMNVYCQSIGGIAVFEVKEDIQVLDFGDLNTIKYIHALLEQLQAPKEVIRAAQKGWKVTNEISLGFKRDSDDTEDRKVAQWLCRNNFGGYIAAAVEGLHDEMMLCNVHESLDYLGFYEPAKDLNFPICNPPYTAFNCDMSAF